MQFNELEPHELPESDLSQIEAFDQGLTSDPGCWAQPVEFSEPERKFDTEEADRYDAWVEGMHEAHCKELGLNPETAEPGRATRVPPGGPDGILGRRHT